MVARCEMEGWVKGKIDSARHELNSKVSKAEAIVGGRAVSMQIDVKEVQGKSQQMARNCQNLAGLIRDMGSTVRHFFFYALIPIRLNGFRTEL